MSDPDLGAVEWLDPVRPLVPVEPFGSTHPIRDVVEAVAAGGGWDAATAAAVAAMFDSLGPGWHAGHTGDERLAALEDAFERGDVGGGCVVELGSGTGAGTERIVPRTPVVAAIDLSAGMLAEADADLAPRVRADGSSLPVRTGAVDVLVAVNMFLFPAEVDRVLAPAGRLVWVNTMAEETPIHLPPERVVEVLPGPWRAVAGRAGTGLWAVATRAAS